MVKFRLFLLFCIALLPSFLKAQTSTINWNSTEQTIQGFGAGNNYIGTAMNSYDNFFFTQLGYSSLRSSVPLGTACNSVSSGCATGEDSVTDMQAAIAAGGQVWAYNNQCTIADYPTYATLSSNFIASLANFEGVPLTAISVLNEPDIGSCVQSVVASGADVDTIVKDFSSALSGAGQSTKIMMPESSLYSSLTSVGNTCAGDSSCFNDVGVVAYHGYDAPSSPTDPYTNPPPLWETEASAGPGYGPNAPGCSGGEWCPTIADAIMWAGLVDSAMFANNSAYHYFWFVDPDNDFDGCNTCNFALINPTESTPISIRAYAIAQWAKFVRPGYVRIDATHVPTSGVTVTAYRATSGGNFAIVAVNSNSGSTTVTFSLSGGAPSTSSVTPWITSSTQSLAQLSNVSVSGQSFSYSLPGNSIVTFAGTAGGSLPQAATPVPSPSGGTYSSTQNVSLSTSSPGAVQCYTTNGTNPVTNGVFGCSNGTLYSTLISISSSLTLKYVAGGSGYLDSPVGTASYTITGGGGGGTNFYIDWSSGNDANAGTSKGAPWQHAPGMTGVAGVPAGHNIAAGDSYIFKGGVTWPAAAFPMVLVFTGSSSSTSPVGCTGSGCIYVGVDQTWFNGGSWTRPIFNGGQTQVPVDYGNVQTVVDLYGGYYVLDNIEFTGWWQTVNTATTWSVIALRASQSELRNNYIHGWGHSGSATLDDVREISTGVSCPPDMTSEIDSNVIDGADTTMDMGFGMGSGVGYVFNNYVSDSPTLMFGSTRYWYGNTLVNSGPGHFDPGSHGNVIESSGCQMIAFNNYSDGAYLGSSFFNTPVDGSVDYDFNNVLVNQDGVQAIQVDGDGLSTGSGSGIYIFNNTLQEGAAQGGNPINLPTRGGTLPFATIYNNFLIATNPTVNTGSHTTTVTQSNQLGLTNAQAASDGYSVSSAYPYTAPSGSAPTVGTGQVASTMDSICSGIPSTSLELASTACLSDSAVGVGYNTGNHTVIVPNRAVSAWPASGPWDIGAYLFGGTPPPPPPHSPIPPNSPSIGLSVVQ